MLGVGFGPQRGNDLVATETALAGGGKEGEQSQGLPLLGCASGRAAVDLYREAAERLEMEHVAPFDGSLTGLLRGASNLARVP